MLGPRTIIHADLDAFFASVEQRDRPELRNKPVLIGSNSGRGVVAAASYEARSFGCRSAMPMAKARALCPSAVVVGPRMDRYSEVSAEFMEILGRFSPLVEPISVDEAFVDVTGSRLLLGSGEVIAQSIRQMVTTDLGISVSVGVASNKFVAKLASDMNKPNGVTVAPIGESQHALAAWLAPIKIERMWGIGERSLPHFIAAGIRNFGDLQRFETAELLKRFGEQAVVMQMRAKGEDDRSVETEHERLGIGHETTFNKDLEDPEQVIDALRGLVDSVGSRLRASAARTNQITLKIRFKNFKTITRSQTLAIDTDSTIEILDIAKRIFKKWADREFTPVRLIGVRVNRTAVSSAGITPIFEDPRASKEQSVDRVADAITRKFGAGAIARGQVDRT